MGKRSGIFIAIAAITMVLLVWGNPVAKIKSAFFPEIKAIAPKAPSDISLSVDQALLLDHVSKVSSPRATPAQKPPIRSYITQQLTSYGLTPLIQSYNNPLTGQSETGGVNIVAELPGSDPSAGAIVLGAHYDTHAGSPGADDNGSAIATLLEAARLFSTASNSSSSPFPATLKIVFFDQEEQQPDGSGLLGSLAFTQLSRNIANLKGAVILDMVGYACRTQGCQQYPDRLPVQTLPETGEFLAVLGLSTHTELIGAFTGSAQTSLPLVLSLPIPEATLRFFPDLLRSDHAPFWERDIPAVFVTDTANFRNPNYHTATDTPETLDPTFFQGSAQHIVNAVATLISQPS